MSELKAISGLEIREDIDYNTRGVDPENKEWRNYGKELCNTLYYRKYEADKVIADLEESHKKEVGQLLMEIVGLKKLVETADKLLKQKGGFTVKDITFNGVNLEGFKKEAK